MPTSLVALASVYQALTIQSAHGATTTAQDEAVVAARALADGRAKADRVGLNGQVAEIAPSADDRVRPQAQVQIAAVDAHVVR